MRFVVCVTLFTVFSAWASSYQQGERLFNGRCISCHGNPGVNLDSPVLHGQERRYLEAALKSFKSGTRQDHIMNFMNMMAQQLSEADVANVSLYLAAQDPCSINMEIDHERPGFREEFLSGRELVQTKNCMHCHGSFHHLAPRLYGQKENFISRSLHAFKSGDRVGFPMMKRIAESLNDEQIRDVSTYLNGMRLMRSCP